MNPLLFLMLARAAALPPPAALPAATQSTTSSRQAPALEWPMPMCERGQLPYSQ